MTALTKLIRLLEDNSSDTQIYIPRHFNSIGFKAFGTSKRRNREITVNPYDFYKACIQSVKDASHPFDANGAIYSMMPRAVTAWDGRGPQQIESGSFLKAIALLPAIKSMGVSFVYLLPVFTMGERYFKGELPSPYAIKDWFTLDKSLHDGLLGEYSPHALDLQFQAFIEACHNMGMKVLMDFVFRSCARDNNLIKDRPDWFYWIDKNALAGFKPPVGSASPMSPLNERNLKKVYSHKSFEQYAAAFRQNPATLDKWAEVKERFDNPLDAAEALGLTTAPAFSDVINDKQPSWDDVTYLRLDMGENQRYKSRAPFIAHDGIKLDKYPPQKPNFELWDIIESVIPYYKQKFSIDGARVDMAHALPEDLTLNIIKKLRGMDEGFILWSEALNIKDAGKEKEAGYNFISGASWDNYYNKKFKKLLYDMSASPLGVVCSLETADTPRASAKFAGKEADAIMAFNAFLPNGIVLINNGQEVGERQPMNLGLGVYEGARYVLPKSDFRYAKLAFFDAYMFHWENEPIDSIKSIMAHRKNAGKLTPNRILALHKRGVFQLLYEGAGVIVNCTGKNKKVTFTKRNIIHQGNKAAYSYASEVNIGPWEYRLV